MSDIWEGKPFPKSTLESTEGKRFEMPADLIGRWSVIYFYPKDDTPGCTKQACGYRDNIGGFKKLGAAVIGVSGDGLQSHDAFRDKYTLNFPLLSDPDHAVTAPLGVFGEHEWKGVKSMGISRDTFIVDPKGVIRKVWRKVAADKTVDETYRALADLIEKEK